VLAANSPFFCFFHLRSFFPQIVGSLLDGGEYVGRQHVQSQQEFACECH
jgi:hypothetical protein